MPLEVSGPSGTEGAPRTVADSGALLDLSHDALFARDRDGRITYWNQGAERMYGYGRAEAEGRVARRLLATVFPVPLAEVEAVIAGSGHWEGELIHHHRDGHAMTVETRIATHQDDDGTVVGTLQICRAVTAPKGAAAERAERIAEIERSERQLAEAQALAHLGSWEWDTCTGVIRWSAELYRIFGDDEATFVPTYETFIESVAPEDRARVDTTIRAAVAAGEPYDLGYAIVRADGERRWVDAKGRLATDARSAAGSYAGTVLDVTDRHLAHVALRQSGAAMADAQRVAGLGSYTLDGRTRVLQWTEEFGRIFGYPIDVPASVPLLMARLHPDDLPRMLDLWDRAESQLEPWKTEARIVLPGGAVRWLASRGQPVTGPGGELMSVHGTVQDITDRREAREQLRFQACLLDAVGEAVVATDLSGTIVHWGPGAEELYGWTGPEVLGRSILEVTPTVSSAATAAEIMTGLVEGGSWSGIVELRRRDGSTFLAEVTDTPVMDAEGHMTAIIGISFDVSEREAAKSRLERVLHERTVQTREQAAVLEVGQAALGGAAGRDVIADAVRSVVETLGVHRSAVFSYRDAIGVMVPEAAFPAGVAHPSMPSSAGDGSIWSDALNDLSPVLLQPSECEELFPGTSPGGCGVWATITVRDRIFGGIGVATDDPMRVFTEHDLNFVASMAYVIGSVIQREELDRLKSEFVSTVSHELRTPLSSVLGYLELLRSGDAGAVSSEQSHMLEVIARNGNRLLALVEDLLTASRIDAGTLQLAAAPVDVGALVESAMQAVSSPLTGRDLCVTVDIEPDLAPVGGDAEQLERTLVNLLMNAIRFTPDGGTVAVRARRTGAAVAVTVSDTGLGIPENEQQHLFERFFRASTARNAVIQGTGLGLSIVKSIIDAHGGTVRIDSTAGAGTTVTVTLPLAGTSPGG